MATQIHGHSARGQQTATGSGEDLDETADCQRMMNTFMTVCVLKSKQGGGVQPSPGSGSGSANKECRQIEDAWLDRCIETTTPKLDLSGSGSGSDLDWFGPKKPWKDEDDGLPMADQVFAQVPHFSVVYLHSLDALCS